MKKIILFFLLMSSCCFGQTTNNYTLIDVKMDKMPIDLGASTDGIASYINSNFKTENDKIRAVFYWTASNITYDVKANSAEGLFQSPQEKITKTLKTKKGVCIDYAEVFNELSMKVGIESYVVQGYTKQNGKIDKEAHAWCVAKIDANWLFFDPTWGAGSASSAKNVKKINNFYFKTTPSKMINSHIPFDYLWQLSNYPITNSDFYQGKTQIDKTKTYFDFEKEITNQKSLSEIDRLFESSVRIEKNGLINTMIVEQCEWTKKQVNYLRQNKNIEKMNAVSDEMNQAVVLLNDFIFYRNNKFKPTLPDDEIANMIQKPKEMFVNCQKEIYSVGAVGSENSAVLNSIKNAIETNLSLAVENESFVKNYLSKSKIVRKTMFSKVSWLGVPLN